MTGAVILISHDRHLIEACADRLWLVANGTVRSFDGDIDDYQRMVLGRSDGTEPAPPKVQQTASQKELRREAAERRESLAPLRKKIKDCEKLLEKLRAEIQKLDGQLAEPGLYAREPERAAGIARERAERVHAFARAESDWLDLSEELEAAEAGEFGELTAEGARPRATERRGRRPSNAQRVSLKMKSYSVSSGLRACSVISPFAIANAPVPPVTTRTES